MQRLLDFLILGGSRIGIANKLQRFVRMHPVLGDEMGDFVIYKYLYITPKITIVNITLKVEAYQVGLSVSQ